MVGDPKWEQWMANFFKPFTRAKVKYFDRSEVDSAWKWLKDNDEGNQTAEEKDRTPDGYDDYDRWDGYPWYRVIEGSLAVPPHDRSRRADRLRLAEF